jgi:hypothetical protein
MSHFDLILPVHPKGVLEGTWFSFGIADEHIRKLKLAWENVFGKAPSVCFLLSKIGILVLLTWNLRFAREAWVQTMEDV